jgi:hypothetical protein
MTRSTHSVALLFYSPLLLRNKLKKNEFYRCRPSHDPVSSSDMIYHRCAGHEVAYQRCQFLRAPRFALVWCLPTLEPGPWRFGYKQHVSLGGLE